MRAANLTPDPEVLRRLLELRGESVQDPVSPAAAIEPVTVPLVVQVGIEMVSPMLDEQARRLFNDFARVYVEAHVHGQTAMYALDLFKAALISKEGGRLEIPGVKKDGSVA
ncbi:MAG: hypothetical protein DDT20_01704 [Firmicutes bacterium]|nr:hypothetical protein [Bacillota bacterium]